MASLNVVDTDGKETGKINISSEILGKKVNSEVLYQEVRRYLASIRSGTHKTKSRSEVSGGGKKPWRQKGTGNARAGSNRSPIWRGGGITFGPIPRNYSFKLNKKVMKQSKLMAFSEKFKNKKIFVIDEMEFKKPDTKKAAVIIKKLNLTGEKVLMVFEDLNNDGTKSFRNIRSVMVESAKGLNAYIILLADCLLFTRKSLNAFMERMSNGRS